MMHDEEAASPRWKLKPKIFGPNIKSIKFLGSVVKARVRQVSGNNSFLGLTVSDRETQTDVLDLDLVLGLTLWSFLVLILVHCKNSDNHHTLLKRRWLNW